MVSRWLAVCAVGLALAGCATAPPENVAAGEPEPKADAPAPAPDPEPTGTPLRFNPPVGKSERYRSVVVVEQMAQGADSATTGGPHSLTMETLVEAKATPAGTGQYKIEEKVVEAKVTGTGLLEAQAAQMQAQRQGQERSYTRTDLGEVVREPGTPGAIPLLVTLPRVGVEVGFKWTGQILISPALMGIEYTVLELTPESVTLEGRLFGEGVVQESPMSIALDAKTGQVRTMEGAVSVTRNGTLSVLKIKQSPA